MKEIHPEVLRTCKAGTAARDGFRGLAKKTNLYSKPATQIQESKKFFFMGAYFAFGLVTDIAEKVEENLAEKLLTKLKEEIEKEVAGFS